MTEVSGFGGHRKIYEDLVKRLANADIATLAGHLNLPINTAGEVEVPFLGATYLISNTDVRRIDRRRCSDVTASALIHYVLTGCSSRPAGIFVPLAELAGPLFKKSSFSQSALEGPIIKRFQGRIQELLSIAASIGGRQGGISGFGSISLIFDVLPNILLQLIFYDKDDEFPARATLLLDAHATQFIDFEALAVLISIFVQFLTNEVTREIADMKERYLEDFEAGQTFQSERIRIDVNRIKSFAAEFDPQPFHLDERAAIDSIFRGLVASGWHTAAITMKLLVEGDLKPGGGIVGASFDEFRWLRPVRPGDELRVESEVLEVRASKSRPDQGVIKVRTTTLNQNNKAVQVLVGNLIVLRGPVSS